MVERSEKDQILSGGEFPVQASLSHEHATDCGAHFILLIYDVVSVDPGLAGGRKQQGRQAFDEGRLTRSVGTEQAKDLALLNIQADRFQGFHFGCFRLEEPFAFLGVIGLTQLFDTNFWIHGSPLGSAPDAARIPRILASGSNAASS